GLRKPLGPNLIGTQHPGQIAVLLLLAAELDQRGPGDGGTIARVRRHIELRELVVIDELLGEAQVHPTVFARPGWARKSVVVHGPGPVTQPGDAPAPADSVQLRGRVLGHEPTYPFA